MLIAFARSLARVQGAQGGQRSAGHFSDTEAARLQHQESELEMDLESDGEDLEEAQKHIMIAIQFLIIVLKPQVQHICVD